MAARNSELDYFTQGLSPKASPKDSELAYFDLPPAQDTWVKPEAPSIKEQIDVAPHLFATEGGAQVWALPSNTAETYRFLAGKLQKLGEEQAAEQGRELTAEDRKLTDAVVNYLPDLIKEWGEKFPNLLPTHAQAKQKLTENVKKNQGLELPEKPRGAIERGAEGLGKAVPILLSPASPWTKIAAAGVSAGGEALDLSEGKKLIGNLTIPAMASLIESIATRRYVPPPGEAAELYKEGKRLGMTDKQLAPIMATEGQVARHGGLAQAVPKTRQAFQESADALGTIMETIQNRKVHGGRDLAQQATFNTQLAQRIVPEFQQILNDIQSSSHAHLPQSQDVINFLKTSISDIRANGTSPGALIGTWRQLNKLRQGKTELRRITDPIIKALESADPQLAKDFLTTNKLYSRYIKNLKEINPSQFNAFIDASDINNLMGHIFQGKPMTLVEDIMRLVSKDALRKMSSKILTDPNAQSLVRKFGDSVRNGTPASSNALAIQFKNYIQKQLPEQYKEIDWEALGMED